MGLCGLSIKVVLASARTTFYIVENQNRLPTQIPGTVSVTSSEILHPIRLCGKGGQNLHPSTG